MKLKRAVIICGFLLTLVIVFTIYSAKELTLSVKKTSITQDYKDVSTMLPDPLFFITLAN